MTPSRELRVRLLDHAVIVALFTLTPLLVFPWRFIAEGMMQLGCDDMLSNLPMLRYSASKLLSGELLWTPDLWLGYSMIGEPEFGVLYPFRLLMLLFRPITGFAIYVYAHFVFAQLTFHYMARSFGLSRAAAIFGAVGYAFGGFMLAHRGHTMYLSAGVFAPLFLALLQRAQTRGGRFAYLGAALAFAAVPFSGAVQLTVYLVLAAVLLALTQAILGRTWRPLRITLLALVPCVLITALLAIPALAVTREATLGARQTYAFNVLLSWHPALLPSLFNLVPVHIEVWLHFGVAVLACAAVGLLATRRNPSVLAWSAVAGVALLLMLGDLIPGLQRALFHLPVIGQTFRGPARHGFELSLAVAMLAAFGLDRLIAGALPGRLVNWILGGLAFILGGTFLAKVTAERLTATQLDPIGMMQPIARLSVGDMAAPAALLLLWLLGALLLRRAPRLGATALSLLALTEAALLLRGAFGDVPNSHAQARELAANAPAGARLMAHPGDIGLSTISLNASLLVPGLQQLTGYASVAPKEMADLLQLDMHGMPMHPEDLRWSRLPAIFGVTHLVTPSPVCDPLPVLRGGPGCGRGSTSLSAGEERSCRGVLGPRPPLGESISAQRQAPGPARLRLELAYREKWRQLAWTSSRASSSRPGPFAAGISVPWSPLPVSYDLILRAPEPLLLTSAQLRTRFEPLAALAPAPVPSAEPLHGQGAVLADEVLLLQPGQVEVARWFELPPLDGAELALELHVRASAQPTTRELVVDVFRPRRRGEPAYDPPGAQLVLSPQELARGEDHALSFTLRDPPPRVMLRAFSVGTGVIALERAELRLPGSLPDGPPRSIGRQAIWQRRAAATPDGELRFVRHSAIGLTVAAPRRPLRLTLTGERAGQGDAASLVSVQISAPDRSGGTKRLATARPTAALELPAGRLRRVWTLAVPGDLPWLDLIVQSSTALRDVALSLESACSRGGQPDHYLGNGLWLHRESAALPRVYSVQRLIWASGVMPAARLLADSPELEPGKTAIVDPAGTMLPERFGEARIERQRFADRQVEVTVEAARGGSFLVVNDRFDPRWRATVDGRPTPIYRANAIVRGLVVPEGRHIVRLWYAAPPSVYLGALCAILGLLAALALPALDARARRAAGPVTPGGP
jgi:hypothetical protein